MIRGKKRENWRASFAFIFLEDVPCVNNIAIETIVIVFIIVIVCA